MVYPIENIQIPIRNKKKLNVIAVSCGNITNAHIISINTINRQIRLPAARMIGHLAAVLVCLFIDLLCNIPMVNVNITSIAQCPMKYTKIANDFVHLIKESVS